MRSRRDGEGLPGVLAGRRHLRRVLLLAGGAKARVSARAYELQLG